MDAGASAWRPILASAGLDDSNALVDCLAPQSLRALAALSVDHRLHALEALKAAGVSRVGQRQKIVSALARHHKGMRAEASGASVPTPIKEHVPLVVAINVHEYPAFILTQLNHIREHVPFDHRVVLNCSEAMLRALQGTPAAALCHPVPIEKRRHHGSLLKGIVHNIELALHRWDFDYLLVLSSRSWFRRPLSLAHDIEACPAGSAAVPVRCPYLDLQYARADGLFWADTTEEMQRGVDVFGAYRRTSLAQRLLREGWPLLHAPHEGLVLERAACVRACDELGGGRAHGADLFEFGAAVEEFALQSLCYRHGLRFGQLSDMGRPGDGFGMGATGEHLPPLTKVLRLDVSDVGEGEALLCSAGWTQIVAALDRARRAAATQQCAAVDTGCDDVHGLQYEPSRGSASIAPPHLCDE